MQFAVKRKAACAAAIQRILFIEVDCRRCDPISESSQSILRSGRSGGKWLCWTWTTTPTDEQTFLADGIIGHRSPDGKLYLNLHCVEIPAFHWRFCPFSDSFSISFEIVCSFFLLFNLNRFLIFFTFL